jgi:hypothetical protein
MSHGDAITWIKTSAMLVSDHEEKSDAEFFKIQSLESKPRVKRHIEWDVTERCKGDRFVTLG